MSAARCVVSSAFIGMMVTPWLLERCVSASRSRSSASTGSSMRVGRSPSAMTSMWVGRPSWTTPVNAQTTSCRTFVDATDIFAPNRPGRPSPREARRPLVDLDARDLLVGSRLRRTFNAVEHVIYVVPARTDAPASWRSRGWGPCVYRGVRHKLLTGNASLIVGAADPRISGNRFFGLRRRRDRWIDEGLRQRRVVSMPWPARLHPPIIAYRPEQIVASGRHTSPSSGRKARKRSSPRPDASPASEQQVRGTENPA